MKKKGSENGHLEISEIKRNGEDFIDENAQNTEEEVSDQDDEDEEDLDQKQIYKKKTKKTKSKREDRSAKIGKGIGKLIGTTFKTIGKVIIGMFTGLFGAGPIGILIAILIMFVTIGFVSSSVTGIIGGVQKFFYTKDDVSTNDTIREQLVEIGELATLEYNYTKVVQRKVSEKYLNVISREANQLYSFDGVIKVGIDCGSLDIKVNKMAKQYIVYVPEIKILSHEIDLNSYKYYFDNIYEGRESLTEHDAEDKEEQEEKVKNEGLLERARTSADETIGRIIRAAINETDTKDYEIVFYHADIAEEIEEYNLDKTSVSTEKTTE